MQIAFFCGEESKICAHEVVASAVRSSGECGVQGGCSLFFWAEENKQHSKHTNSQEMIFKGIGISY